MSSSPDEVASCLEVLVRQLMHLGEAEMVEALAGLDLSLPQVRMLFLLTRRGEAVPIHELATHIGQSVAAAGRNVDALVRLGMVERNESRVDRRVKLISIASAGSEIVDRHITARRKAFRAFADDLPVEQAQALLDALRPIVADLDPVCGPTTKESHD